MLAKKTSKNQITLPKAIVSEFPDVDYFEVLSENGRIILEPVRPDLADKVREKLDALGISERDVEYAIKNARSKP